MWHIVGKSQKCSYSSILVELEYFYAHRTSLRSSEAKLYIIQTGHTIELQAPKSTKIYILNSGTRTLLSTSSSFFHSGHKVTFYFISQAQSKERNFFCDQNHLTRLVPNAIPISFVRFYKKHKPSRSYAALIFIQLRTRTTIIPKIYRCSFTSILHLRLQRDGNRRWWLNYSQYVPSQLGGIRHRHDIAIKLLMN